ASKLAAEQELLAADAPPEIVVVNPASVYGPGDLAGNGQAIIGAVTGRLGVTTDVPTGFVYIEDLGRGIAAALTRGRPRERYILCGQNISRLAFLRRAVELAGVDRPLRAAVPKLWWVFANIYGFQAWLARRRPPISRDAVRIALHGYELDGSKAARELGLTYKTLDDGLDATLDWLQDQGHVDLPAEPEDAGDGLPAS
ncbi:MAG: hypothetical protein FJ029_13105, partial [Actinobacteria bacterium]|nr:hypothetical protein [Actinomycetota bacterium]